MHTCLTHYFSPVPEPMSVTVSRLSEKIYAGSTFSLDCNITLSMNVKEVLESLEISVKWIDPEIEMMASEVKQSDTDSLMYSTSISINSTDHSHDGNYICAAQVKAANSSYLVTSSTASASVEITISMLIALSLILL